MSLGNLSEAKRIICLSVSFLRVRKTFPADLPSPLPRSLPENNHFKHRNRYLELPLQCHDSVGCVESLNRTRILWERIGNDAVYAIDSISFTNYHKCCPQTIKPQSIQLFREWSKCSVSWRRQYFNSCLYLSKLI